MVDIESRSSSTPQNPYAAGSDNQLSAHHPVTLLKRTIYIGISLFVLRHFNFYRVLIRSPHIKHEWFKVGLAATIAMFTIKTYVEMYEGKIKKSKVNYKNFRNTTHAVIGLWLLSTISFHAALWPHYGWNSPIVLGFAFFGVILQIMLMVPTYVQNILGFVALTFFLQEYS